MLTQRNRWSNIIIQKYAHVNFTEKVGYESLFMSLDK